MPVQLRTCSSTIIPLSSPTLTVVLPVINETTALLRTIDILLRDLSSQILEIIVVVCDATTPESMAVIGEMQQNLSDLLIVHRQTLPYLGGALREAFAIARGSHTVLMASDLETDPNDLSVMVELAAHNPGAIVSASRWLKGGGFSGYSPIKLVLNRIFQWVFAWLYRVPLKDMTFAYRIYPTALLQRIRWEELRHPFLFEALVKPLRLGTPVIEVSSRWQARTEGTSQNSFWRNFAYLRIGIKSRLANPSSLLKQSLPTPISRRAAAFEETA